MLELKRLERVLVKLVLKAPQCAQLWGTGPLGDYHQPDRPRLIPEGEDGRLEAWPVIDQ